MAGHSKWKQIKHKKAVTDAKKSQTFSKIIRLLTVEAKKVAGDINSPNLRRAIERARAENMPNDNIERAIKKALEAGGEKMEPVIYETYGPGSCAIIIEGLTSNRNKAAAEIRHILSKQELELSASGSATWAFEKKDGVWEPKNTVPLSEKEAEKLSQIIDELEENDEVQDVYTNAE
ncbi:MAG: YebC/PmpR family DNA-binding transcriptional regulator [Candidatus Pacebacteria bacterium]|nr:YebC/PmpR family DNA-binding transcriptional regulator [Candidatus Paceibacterota bacterium]